MRPQSPFSSVPLSRQRLKLTSVLTAVSLSAGEDDQDDRVLTAVSLSAGKDDQEDRAEDGMYGV